jgi:DNA repair photolyase
MTKPIKGRGAQFNPDNPFDKLSLSHEDWDGVDIPPDEPGQTKYYHDQPKNIVNKVDSPDIGHSYSMNPYQGCEHGCIYCYARNTHNYYGFSAGVDFEQKIIVKETAPQVLEKQLQHPKWEVRPIMLAGNTDCYQPVERKLEITRKLLKVLVKYRHPVSILTKNSLILRDLDLLTVLAKDQLVHAGMTITTLDENLRRKLEPRTASAKKRLDVLEQLTAAGIPTTVMISPVIPGLTDHEIPAILEAAAARGVYSAGYIVLRLNGAIGPLFEDWIRKHFPDRAEKVLGQVRQMHGGELNDNRFGRRMRGEGPIADAIRQLFKINKKRLMGEKSLPPYNLDAFLRTDKGQMRLFGTLNSEGEF